MIIRQVLVACALGATLLATPMVADAAGTEVGTVYEVRPGDSLSGIAARYDVSIASLLRVNDLQLTSLILPGQHLQLPAGATATTPAADPAAAPSTTSTTGGTHTVEWGDSLSGIAARYDVSIASLLRVNDLQLTSLILPGRHLQLPAGATATTPAADPAAAPSTASTTGGTHTVEWGDSLSGIAARYDVSIASLLRVNDLQLTSLILPGQHLQLPAGATATTPAADPAAAPSTASTTGGTHTVEWGDSLSGIAARYDVSIASLLRVNDLQLTSLILPGRHLQLPAGATATTPAAAKTENRELQTVLTYARAQIGKPYRFFTRGPDAFDCSGLTAAAYARAGITLIHYSAAQSLQGTAVDFEHETIKPGDLVFLKRHGSTIINHVGIAVTSSIWIQATGPGDTVRIGPMPAKSTISAVRRYIDN